MPKVVRSNTDRKEPDMLNKLRQMQLELEAEARREAFHKSLADLEAETLIENMDHWLTHPSPPLVSLFHMLPDLLPYPDDELESIRISLGIAYSRHPDNDEVLKVYSDRWDESHPFKFDASLGLTEEECRAEHAEYLASSFPERISAWAETLVHSTSKPYTLDGLLRLARKHRPDFDLGLWQRAYANTRPHAGETAEKQEDDKQTRASELLAAMEFGVAYSISDFVGEGKLYTSDRYCRKVMGSLVDSGKVTKLGDKKGTRYTLAGGEMRTVETPPNIFPAKKGD